MPDHNADTELLNKLLGQFEDAFDQTITERERSEQCRDYYDGFQWSDEEIEVLKRRKQPIVTSNRIKPKIDALLGFEKRQRTDPRAFPRTPKHDKDAEGATDALRFVCDENRFQQVRSEAAENVFIEGIGAATVGVRQVRGEFKVTITAVPWDRFYRDPHSRRRNFSDASFMGVVLWMDEAEAKLLFKGKDDVLVGAYALAAQAQTYEDRPSLQWCDSKRKRVRVLQHRWLKDGVWHTATLCKGGFLRDPQPSPYLDEEGQPECDLIGVSAYVTRQNERYGVAWQMLSAQDEINKRRSKALHRLSVNQIIAEHGAVADVAHAKAEMAKPDGYVEVNKDFKFDVRDGTMATQGEMELLREAKAEIDASGVNPSLEGDQSAPSGRSQEIQQQSALSEMAVVFDALRDWSWSIYRASWNRIRQYWDDERWVRVTDDENNLKWVGINRPVTAAEEAQKLQEQGQPIPPELMQVLQINPQQVMRMENPVAEVDVDIIVEDGPDSVTIQSEQYSALIELKKADPASIPTEMIIESSNLRNKDRILEKLQSGGIPPQVQQQMQEMQQKLQEAGQKIQQADQAAQTEKTQAEAMRDRTQADIKMAIADMEKREAQMQAQQAQWELQQVRAELQRLMPTQQPYVTQQ